MADVSVIMPTYNRAGFLIESLASALNQTFGSLEIFVIDDGSTDNTEDVIATFKDRRIHYIKQQHCGAVSMVRNRGIKESKGLLVTFLDSDDRWAPDTIMRLRDFLLERSDCGLAYGPVEQAGNFRSTRIERHLKNVKRKNGYVFPELLMDNFIFIQSVLMRRECIDRVGFFNEDSDILIGEDWDFFLRICYHYKVGYVDGALGYYNFHGENINKDPVRSCLDEIKIINVLSSKLEIDKRLYNRAIAKRHFFLGKQKLLDKDLFFSRDFRLALNMNKRSLYFWSGFFLSFLPVSMARYIYVNAKKIYDRLLTN